MSRTKFLNSGIALYKQIIKIKKDEKVKAKYCPQWIPIWSIPSLLKSDFDKIKKFSLVMLLNILKKNELTYFFNFFEILKKTLLVL